MEENKEVKVKKKTNIKKTILLTMGSLGFLALGTCLGYYLAIYTDGHDKIRKNTTVTSNEQSNVVSNTNSNANTIVVKKKNDQYVVEDSSKEMTSEKAFKMLKKGIYDKDGIYLVGTEITQKGDNDSYLVISTCYMAQNVDGKIDRAYHGGGSSLFYYKDGKWYFTYPATGYADTPFKEYNLKEYKLASYTELTDKAAYEMIEEQRIKLNITNWTPEEVKVTKKGDNNTYLISYKEKNTDYTSDLGLIMTYNNNQFVFSLPGFSGANEEDLKKYNFKDINY